MQCTTWCHCCWHYRLESQAALLLSLWFGFVQLWPMVALINHKYVPLQFRVLFINIVAVFW